MTRLSSVFAISAAFAVTMACGRSPVSPTSRTADTAAGASAVVTDAAGGGATVAAKGGNGGGKPPSLERPVVAELRCAEGHCADGLRSDGAPYHVMIGGDGNLAFSLADAPGRTVVFDFSDCVDACTGGNRWFTTTAVGASHNLWMHTSVLTPGTDNETPQGVHDIPIGATWFSRIKILFRVFDPSNREFAWAIRFNPFFQGSTNLQVTRLGESQWVLEALPSQIAWTQSALLTRKPRDQSEVFEGNYRLPFLMTIRVQ